MQTSSGDNIVGILSLHNLQPLQTYSKTVVSLNVTAKNYFMIYPRGLPKSTLGGPGVYHRRNKNQTNPQSH